MPELQILRADHAAAVLVFERENREYFARWITDRGDDFFEHFDERHRSRRAEQEEGSGAYYVLVADDGSVLGRFNLIIDGDVGRLGYRMTQAATGRGLATQAVRELCELARSEHGIVRVVAATSTSNVASQRVLLKAGFARVGPADPADVGGKQGYLYERSSTQL